MTAIKLLVGLIIVGVIVSQLAIRDEVTLEDGTVVEGSIVSLDGTIEVKGDDGAWSAPLSLREDPPEVRRSPTGRWRVSPKDGRAIEGDTIRLAGEVRIDQPAEAGTRVINLQDLGWRKGGQEDGFEEQILDAREGLATIYGRVSLDAYLLALACILGMYLCGIKRWQILLRTQRINVGFFEATRLTFIGFFFNNVVPGLTGGDVVKAVLIARLHKGRGPDAISTVIVDRILGLLVLAAVAAVALLFALDRFGALALWVFVMLAGACVLIALFLSRRLRRWVRLDRILSRLPGADALKRLDQAFLLYRSHGPQMAVCVLISVVSHIFNILSVSLIGLDIGVDAAHGLQEPVHLTYFIVVPIVMIVAAIPMLPGGWGLGEAAFGYFFRTVGIRNLTLSVGLSVLHRVSMLLFSLLGGVFLLLSRSEARAAIQEAEMLDSGADARLESTSQ